MLYHSDVVKEMCTLLVWIISFNSFILVITLIRMWFQFIYVSFIYSDVTISFQLSYMLRIQLINNCYTGDIYYYKVVIKIF